MNELLSLNPVVNSNDLLNMDIKKKKKKSLPLKRASPISLDNIITLAIHCSYLLSRFYFSFRPLSESLHLGFV